MEADVKGAHEEHRNRLAAVAEARRAETRTLRETEWASGVGPPSCVAQIAQAALAVDEAEWGLAEEADESWLDDPSRLGLAEEEPPPDLETEEAAETDDDQDPAVGNGLETLEEEGWPSPSRRDDLDHRGLWRLVSDRMSAEPQPSWSTPSPLIAGSLAYKATAKGARRLGGMLGRWMATMDCSMPS